VGGLALALGAASTDTTLPHSLQLIPSSLGGAFRTDALRLGDGGVVCALIMMFGCYVVAVELADRLPARTVIATIIALDVLVLLAPPLFSTDIFSYQAYGRMWASYGLNPYYHGPQAIALDPIYPYVGSKWIGAPTVYGPLFTLLSGALAGTSIAAGVIAFKGLALAATLGTVALLWRTAPLRGVDPVRSIALFGLNPLVVVYGIGGGHNDLLMAFALTAALYALLAGRPREGGAMVAVAVGVKLTAGLVLPFALAAPHARRRALAAGTACALAVVALVGWLVFGSSLVNLPGSIAQSQSAGDWHSIPGLISVKLGFGNVGHLAGGGLELAFVSICCYLLWRVWRGELDWVLASGWATVALLVTATSLLPWYVVWLLPLAALTSERRLWRAALVLTGVVQVLQLIDYIPHAAPWLGL
jgi:alpha-1,6-mannosyltransferase